MQTIYVYKIKSGYRRGGGGKVCPWLCPGEVEMRSKLRKLLLTLPEEHENVVKKIFLFLFEIYI